MSKRAMTMLPTVFMAYAVWGSVVFLGVPLSSRLLGQWRVVEVFGQDLTRNGQQALIIRFDKDGRLEGRSACGTFTGSWTTAPDQVRFQALRPSHCDQAGSRTVEQRVLHAMSVTRETRVVNGRVMLMHEGRPLVMLEPQRT
ncbi:MAG: META domain-containing protein [Flavobacteriales bacterium]